MVEPVVSVATESWVINVGNISLVGYVFGMPAEPLLFGFFGALAFVMAYKGDSTRTETFSFIMIGVLLAGTMSPLVANAIYLNVGWVGFPASQMIQNTIALMVGGLWQWLMPHVWRLVCTIVSSFIFSKTKKKDVDNGNS